MATSIDKSVNWRNAAAAPDYQVTARQVDTFVQGERNTKGMQVAAALDSAAGTVSQVGKNLTSKAKEQVTNLELLRASNASSELIPAVQEFAETYDYSIKDGKRPTSAEVWEAFTSSNPAYQDTLSSLTTDTAKNSFNKVIGGNFYTTYGTSVKSFEIGEEDVELGNFAINALRGETLSASSPEFLKLFKDMDESIQSMDRSPQEAKKLLMSTALRSANEDGDFRLYSLLLGEVEGQRTILSNDEYDLAFRQREAVQSRMRAEQNRLASEKVAGVKQAKVTLQSTIGNLFTTGEATTENLIAAVKTAEDAGVGTAASDADKIYKAYKSLSTEEIDAGDMIDLYDGYIQAPDKIDWLNRNSSRLDEGLLNTFLTQAPRQNPYQGKAYVRANEIVKTLVRDNSVLDMFVEAPRFAPLRLMFEEDFLALSTSPEWHDMKLPERNEALFKVIQKLQGYKKLIGEDDFMSPEEIRLKAAVDGALN